MLIEQHVYVRSKKQSVIQRVVAGFGVRDDVAGLENGFFVRACEGAARTVKRLEGFPEPRLALTDAAGVSLPLILVLDGLIVLCGLRLIFDDECEGVAEFMTCQVIS